MKEIVSGKGIVTPPPPPPLSKPDVSRNKVKMSYIMSRDVICFFYLYVDIDTSIRCIESCKYK